MRRSLAMPGFILGCVAWVMSGAVPGIASADESVDALKRQLAEMQENMDELKERIHRLEDEKTEPQRVTRLEDSVKAIQKSPSILNPSIGMAIDTSFARRGEDKGSFHLRSAELGIAAEVDPYARAHAFIVGTEDGIELEEAAVTTTSLPYNLTGQAGRFFAAFGRLAQFHQHELPFVNTPLSINRMVGGEALATGTQWTWLLPTPFFLSLTGGVYNDIGHTHGHSEGEPSHEDEHEGEEGEDEEGEGHDEDHEGEHDEDHDEGHDEDEGEDHDHAEEGHDHGGEGGGSRFLSELTYLARLHTFFDLTETLNVELGSSLAYTPRMDVDEEMTSDRSRFGLDLTFRHRPLTADIYEGFTLAGELFGNDQRFHDVGRKKAWGGYAYAQVDFNPEVMGRWNLGLLLDVAPDLENPRAKTRSLSPYVSWWPSEFHRLRLQYTHGWDKVGETPGHDGSQIFLQWTTALGSHTHGFRQRQ